MRSLRVAGSPLNREISPPPGLQRSQRSLQSQRFLAKATTQQLINITCGEISKALNDAAEVLDDNALQHVCAEILVYSEDAIKTKSINLHTNVPSRSFRGLADEVVRHLPTNVSFKEAYNYRQAELVKESSNPELKVFVKNNALDLFGKLPNDEGEYDMFLTICDPDLMAEQEEVRRDYLTFKRYTSNESTLLLNHNRIHIIIPSFHPLPSYLYQIRFQCTLHDGILFMWCIFHGNGICLVH